MSLKVRRVRADWQHPRGLNGKFIPMHEIFPYTDNEIAEGVQDGWLKNDPPTYGLAIMPQWPTEERTHYQMYETVSEGTPVSPVMNSPEALAHWLADNKVKAGPGRIATYGQWLEMIKVGSSCGSFVVNLRTGEIISGVEMVSADDVRQN